MDDYDEVLYDREEALEEKKVELIYQAMSGHGDFWPAEGKFTAEYDNEQELEIMAAVRQALRFPAATKEARWNYVERAILKQVEIYAEDRIEEERLNG